ncbi:MAG: helix-turn-helix domain-containing protein [Candidatus Aminicenantes bacterium]|nr:helix-turn-helix domain-containing protein [Candidatus Aminicenantes bacterium]NIM81192.1 helix-turn-helix domain-containing protein [Candidatus Aminicenantes bacterium]NIN20567.1 helix-turn-helix domain-containing protein [Candidatus Aminicenantes bacterium]NIN44346.1 helix-turn-helix domain-containing protein [Candidatus Aminicenantes bacterium]NIN87165.1 helix-turn-helix domain-containing protein [Candidatus Aminicenantes bacterium]
MRRSDLIELGLRLKLIRKKLRKTQKTFARGCGMSDNYMSEIEAGRYNPGYDFLKNAVKRYKINFGYLATGEGPMFMDPAANPGTNTTTAADAKTRKETKSKSHDYDETDDEIEKMLRYMKQIRPLKYAMLAYFNQYLYENKGMIEEQLETT